MITKLSYDIQAEALQKLAMIRTTGLKNLGGKKSVMDKLRLVFHVLKDPPRPEGLNEFISQMVRDSRMARTINSGGSSRINNALRENIRAKKEAPEVFQELGLYPNGMGMPSGTMDIRARTNALNRTFDLDFFDNWRLPFYTGR